MVAHPMKFGKTVQERAEVRIGVLLRSDSAMFGNAVKNGPEVRCAVGQSLTC